MKKKKIQADNVHIRIQLKKTHMQIERILTVKVTASITESTNLKKKF